MPQKPSAGGGSTVIVDTDQKWYVELVGLDEQPNTFPGAKEGVMSLVWKFRLFDPESGVAVIDDYNAMPYELWQFTSDATYRNAKTAKVAKAREWAEALIGKGELSDQDICDLIDDGFAEALIGRRGIADVEYVNNAAGEPRLKIIRLKPMKKKAKEQPAAEPVAVAAAPAKKKFAMDEEDLAA